MRALPLLAALAIAVPALAQAQVGPNPAANGSLDPTVSKGGDPTTAPDDVPVGADARDGTVAEPLPDPADAADANTVAPADGTGNSTVPLAPAAAAAKKTTAPTSESARKPR